LESSRTKTSVGTITVRLRPDAEASFSLRDALIMPAHPVALTHFGSGSSLLG
jgi:hypothetical protein